MKKLSIEQENELKIISEDMEKINNEKEKFLNSLIKKWFIGMGLVGVCAVILFIMMCLGIKSGIYYFIVFVAFIASAYFTFRVCITGTKKEKKYLKLLSIEYKKAIKIENA